MLIPDLTGETYLKKLLLHAVLKNPGSLNFGSSGNNSCKSDYLLNNLRLIQAVPHTAAPWLPCIPISPLSPCLP